MVWQNKTGLGNVLKKHRLENVSCIKSSSHHTSGELKRFSTSVEAIFAHFNEIFQQPVKHVLRTRVGHVGLVRTV